MRTRQLEDTLRALKLFGMLDTLEARLAQTSAGEPRRAAGGAVC